MDTIEFRTKIKDGMIEIPAEYRGQLKNRAEVRVILSAEKSERKGQTLIDQLMKKPIHVQNFQPLKRDNVYER